MDTEGCDASHMDAAACLSVAISTAVFATTIHTQDFKDEEGDRLTGRMTLPIMSPQLGRASILPLLAFWSIAVSFVWQLTWAYSILLLCFSVLVGVRFLLLRNRAADQTSFLLYNVSPNSSMYRLRAQNLSGVVVGSAHIARLLAVHPISGPLPRITTSMISIMKLSSTTLCKIYSFPSLFCYMPMSSCIVHILRAIVLALLPQLSIIRIDHVVWRPTLVGSLCLVIVVTSRSIISSVP